MMKVGVEEILMNLHFSYYVPFILHLKCDMYKHIDHLFKTKGIFALCRTCLHVFISLSLF